MTEVQGYLILSVLWLILSRNDNKFTGFLAILIGLGYGVIAIIMTLTE